MEFIFRRDRTIASVHGHCISFKKGEPTYVPAALHAEVMQAGGEPVEKDYDPTAPDPKMPVPEPTDPIKRGDDIFAAVEMLVSKNSREDFTAAGSPHVKALAQLLGWKPSNAERNTQWLRFQAGKDD